MSKAIENKASNAYDGMKCVELQKIIGERIRVALKDDLSPEERQIENEQSALVFEGAKQFINLGDLVLRTEKLAAQCHALTDSVALEMIK